MMAVGLAIGGDVHELRPAAVLGESADQAAGKTFAVGKQAFESDGAGDGAIVEKQIDAATRRKIADVGTRGIDLAALHVLELDGADAPLLLGLRGGEDGELDSVGGEHFKGLDVDGGLGQPHAFGRAIEAVFEVADAPDHLSLLVAAIGQRHDHVVVDLRNR